MNKKIALLVLLIAPSLYAKENRCGWLENPTPGNYWLTDKDGDWTISTQGKEGPTGMEYLVGFPSKEFINTNNSNATCLPIDKARVFQLTCRYQHINIFGLRT
ncbi:DUF4087 domain-containing protein, partial [Klebsiella pneumoniae]